MAYLREAQTALPLSKEAPRDARRWLRSSGVVPLELDDLAALLVSELVSNSVVHSGLAAPETVSVRVAAFPGGISVEVVDTGMGFSDLAKRRDRSFGPASSNIHPPDGGTRSTRHASGSN